MATTLIAVTAGAVALAALVWQWITRREVRRLRERRSVRATEPERSIGRGGPGSGGQASTFVGEAPAETRTPAPRDVRPEPAVLLSEPGGAAVEAPAIVAEGAGGRRTADVESTGPSRPAGRSEAAVLELLDDDRPDVRRSAVAALAAGGGAHALRGLSYAAARDPAVEVRREAILGIRSLVERRFAPAEGGSSRS
ncbi:MAG TPA: hypothetical protein VFC04_05790 [Actinomycetota bacterium]|nr:hypothetical protein [Actinomycetota bacterium]